MSGRVSIFLRERADQFTILVPEILQHFQLVEREKSILDNERFLESADACVLSRCKCERVHGSVPRGSFDRPQKKKLSRMNCHPIILTEPALEKVVCELVRPFVPPWEFPRLITRAVRMSHEHQVFFMRRHEYDRVSFHEILIQHDQYSF